MVVVCATVTLRDLGEKGSEKGCLLVGVGEVEVEVGPDQGFVEQGRDSLGEFFVLDFGEPGLAVDLGDVDAEDLGDEGGGDAEG